MKNYKFILVLICILFFTNFSYSQRAIIYTAALQCLFIESKDSLACDIPYDSNAASGGLIKGVKGFGITDFFSLDNNGKRCLKIKFWHYIPNSSFLHLPKDSIMNITMYFAQIPDTVNYYMFINKFEPGKTKTFYIPADIKKKVQVDICCKLNPYSKTNEFYKYIPSYEITEYVNNKTGNN